MEKKKIMFVFGTRPEAIKMAPLVKECQKHQDILDVIVCVTGQHREMLDQVLDIFNIYPDYDLNIMKPGQDLYDVTTMVLMGLRDVLTKTCPDLVLVHGDTTSSTAAALAAFYKQIPVGHVEAGLRTHNIYSPWPEEMNRQITGRISSVHFTPTSLSRQNLLAEGISDDKIFVVGNTVIDALHTVLKQVKEDCVVKEQVVSTLRRSGLDESLLTAWNDKTRPLILITGHRRENFGEGFTHICMAIRQLAEKYPFVDFVYPMHLNPNVRRPIMELFGANHSMLYPNVYLIEPLDYLPFVYLMDHSYLVLTDSGGIQEEAPGLGKPVLVMRDTTERPEAVEAGTVRLVGTDFENIMDNVSELLENEFVYEQMSKAHNPYGDGKTSEIIVDIISKL